MIAFKYKVPNLAVLNAEKGAKVTQKLISKYLSDIIPEIQTNIKVKAPVGATGSLRDGIQMKITGNTGRVFTTAPYSAVIERGRKAAPVSQKADPSLARWLKATDKGNRMLAITRKMMMKNRRTAPSEVAVMRSAIFILKRSMKLRKRKPNPYFSKGIDNSAPYIRKRTTLFSKQIASELKK